MSDRFVPVSPALTTVVGRPGALIVGAVARSHLVAKIPTNEPVTIDVATLGQITTLSRRQILTGRDALVNEGVAHVVAARRKFTLDIDWQQIDQHLPRHDHDRVPVDGVPTKLADLMPGVGQFLQFDPAMAKHLGSVDAALVVAFMAWRSQDGPVRFGYDDAHALFGMSRELTARIFEQIRREGLASSRLVGHKRANEWTVNTAQLRAIPNGETADVVIDIRAIPNGDSARFRTATARDSERPIGVEVSLELFLKTETPLTPQALQANTALSAPGEAFEGTGRESVATTISTPSTIDSLASVLRDLDSSLSQGLARNHADILAAVTPLPTEHEIRKAFTAMRQQLARAGTRYLAEHFEQFRPVNPSATPVRLVATFIDADGAPVPRLVDGGTVSFAFEHHARGISMMESDSLAVAAQRVRQQGFDPESGEPFAVLALAYGSKGTATSLAAAAELLGLPADVAVRLPELPAKTTPAEARAIRLATMWCATHDGAPCDVGTLADAISEFASPIDGLDDVALLAMLDSLCAPAAA